MSDLSQDIRHGVRILLKSPRFTLLAVLTLALGIGGTTAVFSVVQARLFRPLPFDHPEELVWLMRRDNERGLDRFLMSGPNFLDLRREARSFERLAAARTDDKTVLVAESPARRVQFLIITPEVFPMLGVQASEGRVFTSEDAPSAALISPRFRSAHFADGEAVLGRAIRTEDGVFEVIGVLPEGLAFPPRPADLAPDIWTPLDFSTRGLGDRGAGRLVAYGRLRDGVAPERATDELQAIAARLAEAYPETNEHAGVSLGPLDDLWHDSVREESPVLLAAVGFVLLIGCANIANLLLARLSARRGEMSVRMALGASRSRLVRQLLTESLLLAAAGWAAGLPLAYWGVQGLAAMTPPMTALVGEIEIDGPVLLFSLLATLASGVLFGILPAIATPARALSGAIRQGGQSLLGGKHKLRSTLIAAEITLSLVSLVAAGLMLRGMAKAMLDDPGFNPESLLTFRTSAPVSGERSAQPFSLLYAETAERLAALPGVRSAAFANRVPMTTGGNGAWFEIVGHPSDSEAHPPYADYRQISPGYFQTMQCALLEGRYFDERDDASAPQVAIVNQAFAKQFLDGAPALGQTLRLRGEQAAGELGAPVTIVGVSAGEKYWRLDMQPQPEIYVPFAQDPTRTVEFAVRAQSGAADIAAAVRSEMTRIDPARPLSNMQLMEQRIDASLATPRFSTVLLSLFAALGLLLAAIGVYGVMAQAVAERTRELGLRAALGATRAQVERLVFAGGLRIVGVGLLLGVASALAASRLLQHLYHFRGVSPHDPLTFVIAVATLLGAALLACYLPARRAARIEPMAALRDS